jgi:hypothetical protein
MRGFAAKHRRFVRYQRQKLQLVNLLASRPISCATQVDRNTAVHNEQAQAVYSKTQTKEKIQYEK